jgi:hypothetical protein
MRSRFNFDAVTPQCIESSVLCTLCKCMNFGKTEVDCWFLRIYDFLCAAIAPWRD